MQEYNEDTLIGWDDWGVPQGQEEEEETPVVFVETHMHTETETPVPVYYPVRVPVFVEVPYIVEVKHRYTYPRGWKERERDTEPLAVPGSKKANTKLILLLCGCALLLLMAGLSLGGSTLSRNSSYTPPRTGTIGMDYVAGPPASVLRSEGVSFVCRYLSEDNPFTHGKIVTRGEAQALSASGIAIVSNYEWYATRALMGYDAGVQDAQIAAAQHQAAGGPQGRPIYFSVDTDTSGPQVSAYFAGVASVLGLSRTGAYGSYRVLKYLFDNHLIAWGWQTYAWSYGAWEPRAQIQQYQNSMSLGGHSVDYDRAATRDYGQWLA